MSIDRGAVAAEPSLRTALAACRRYFVNAAVFSAALNLLYLAPTIYMLQVYDRAVPTRGVLTLGMLTAILLVSVATMAALDLARMRLLAAASARLDRQLAGVLIDSLLRAGNAGGRGAAVLREFDSLRQTLTGIGVLALFDLPWSPVYVLACFLLHWSLGVMAIGACIVLGVLSWLAERAARAPTGTATQMAQRAFMSVEASVQTAPVLGALGMRAAMTRRHLRERAAADQLVHQATHDATGYTAVIKALRLLMQSLALGMGALLAIEQQISGGAVFAASVLVARVLAPIVTLTEAWKGIVKAVDAHRAISGLLDEVGPERERTLLPDPLGRIAAEGVSVVPPGRDKPVVQGVSFALEPGEMLGVVGPSGAGKSMLIKALVGALPLAEGTVRVDGAALDDWPDRQQAAIFGYLPQEIVLYQGTIKENIARFATEYGASDAIDAEVVRAAQLCGAHDFILRLPQAYETPLGWGGSGLSVGQAQRVALARAVFGRPRILVLDEPNASLDADGETALIDAIAELKAGGATVIVVAHRASVLRDADKLMVMRDGMMAMFGMRDDVLQQLAAPPPRPATATPEMLADATA